MSEHDEIRRMMAEYCLGTDTGDTERWVACFADDIVWEGGAFGRFAGKEEARAYHQAAGDASKSFRHINTGHAIAVEGDRASADSYIQVYDQSGPSPTMIFSGFYRDQLVKQGGRWLIRSRELIADGATMARTRELTG